MPSARQYQRLFESVGRLMAWDAREDTPAGRALEALATLAEEYELSIEHGPPRVTGYRDGRTDGRRRRANRERGR